MRKPNKFVSLHNHSGASAYDGLGLPADHFQFCLENGLDAHAVTEHGHFNSYASAQLWVEKWNKTSTSPFKYLPGIEIYFHPDLEQWRIDKDIAEQAAFDKKAANKLRTAQEKNQTKIVAVTDGSDETFDIEISNALTVENEDESKSSKHFNPINRRHHLVLVPKNDAGLQELFHLTSRSFLEGFYRFPRVDIRMLKETLTKGNVVASSACIAGLPAFNVFQVLQGYKFDQLTPDLLDDKAIMEKCVGAVGNAYEMMTDLFGRSDYYLELQLNRLGAQDVVNRAIVEFSRRSGTTDKLIVTCDAHYYNPNVWREREIYKKLGYMNYTSYSPDALPKSRDELKCELYPKNADQLWTEYGAAKERAPFYDAAHDEIFCDAIERTYDLAHHIIGDVKPDRSIKLPKKLIPENVRPIEHLVKLCVEGLKQRGLKDKKEYVERLKYELDVIDKVNMPEYFITLAKILELAREVVFVGCGRGSGCGSLVNYVLHITDLDPIRWNLPFERFMTTYRCLEPSTLVTTKNGSKQIKDVKLGELVLTHKEAYKKCIANFRTKTNIVVTIVVNGQKYRCTPNHKWIVKRNGKNIVVTALELKENDQIMIKK